MNESAFTKDFPMPYYAPRVADERSSENITFVMPTQLEDFLFVTAVLSSYRGWLMAQNRKAHYKIVCKKEWQPLLHPIFDGSTTPGGSSKRNGHSPDVIYSTEVGDDSRNSDFLFQFRREDAYAISVANKRHAVDSYGTMIGAGATSIVPCYGRHPLNPLGLVVYLSRHPSDFSPEIEWPDYSDFCEEFAVVHDFPVRALDPGASLSFGYEVLSSASLCIGISGGWTALAAALGKPLFELYPTEIYHPKWAVKMGENGQATCSAYRVLRKPLDSITSEEVVRGVSGMIADMGKYDPRWKKESLMSSTPNQIQRKMNYDGTIDICCRDCGVVIEKSQPYRGFSTIQCKECYKRSLDPDYIPDPLPMAEPLPFVEELALRGFKASGIKRVMSRVIEAVTKQVAKRKRRITRD